MIDRLVKSHKCWGDMWHNFSGWLHGPKRLFVFRTISSLYMLLLPFHFYFPQLFLVSECHRHLQEIVIPSPKCPRLLCHFRPFSMSFNYKCSPSYSQIFIFWLFLNVVRSSYMQTYSLRNLYVTCRCSRCLVKR